MIKEIWSAKDMEALALEWGFLPFFKNELKGFSIEEHTPPELWYDSESGDWAPFDARFDDGLASYKDKELYDAIAQWGSLQTGQLKKICGYGGKDGKKGYETCVTRLQMQTYINVANFDYAQDKYGRPYGWGIARYTTPEAQFGYEAVTAAYGRKPEESLRRMVEHLQKLLPLASEKQLLKLLQG